MICTMKNVLPVLMFGCLAVFVVNATLIDYLNAIHTSPGFGNLTHREQIVLIEMAAEAQAGELKVYIDTIGLQNVLAVIDALPEQGAHRLTQLLIAELNKEEHTSGTTSSPVNAVGKRDLSALLNYVNTNAAYQHLSSEQRQLATELAKAASSNTLDQMIHQVGYASVLALIDALPEQEAHVLSTYMIKHLPHLHNGH